MRAIVARYVRKWLFECPIVADSLVLPRAPARQQAILQRLRWVIVLSAEMGVAFVVFYACLFLLDFPLLDAYPDRHLKTLHYPNINNVYRDEDYSRYHINSYGLIGEEPAPLTDQTVFRIAVFGDSFVEALQVPNDKKFTTLLQRRLTAPAPWQRVEVWNFGHAADNTGNEYARWLDKAEKVHFNFVIFSFNDGDMLENRPEDTKDRSGSFLIQAPNGDFRLWELDEVGGSPRFPKLNKLMPRFHYFNYLLRTRVQDYIATSKSSIARSLQAIIDRVLRKPASLPLEGQTAAVISGEQIENTFQQLKYVQREIEKTGTPALILGLPTDAAAPPGFISYQRESHVAYLALAAKLSASAIPFVDSYPRIAADIASGNDPYSDWEPARHFNARGHALVTDALVTYFANHPLADRKTTDGKSAQ